jgi:CRISPR-associated protein (TIGR03986 family)
MAEKTITAPYGFVPLNDKVVCPDWVQPRKDGDELVAPPVHDVPFKDGICGSLDLEIEAETPIFTRGTEGGGESFFALPDGRFALPGTMLKGAIRNVVEIASFGHLGGRINDHRYAVRDLQNRELYGQFMADIVYDERTRKREPMPLVNAGWLRRKPGDGEDDWTYEIEACDFAKIEYAKLEEAARAAGIRDFHPGEKQSSVSKYEKWDRRSRKVDVAVRWQRPSRVNEREMPSRYGKVESIKGELSGTLVFTGQPARYTPDRSGQRRRGNAKHHDFVFISAAQPRTLRVDGKVFRDFEFAHSDRGQQNRLGRSETPNEEWKYWQEKLESDESIPVFFLATKDARGVKAFGLAMMFRLPYEHSIGEAVRNAQRGWTADRPALDLADGLFGTVLKLGEGRDARTLALKSRVDFSHAVAVGTPRAAAPVKTVLGAPKASYYPNYVEQWPGAPGSNPPLDSSGKPRYTTLQDADGRPRGFKRYRTMTQTWSPKPPTGSDGRQLSLENVSTRFSPLPQGTRFAGKVHVHNVLPEELGALLWALDFGKDGEARHALGMARPLGYGRCRIRVARGADLVNVAGTPVDLDSCRRAFETYMGTQVQNWIESAEIRELRALARPVTPDRVRYQRLDPGARVNEFVDAKKDGLALPSAYAGPRPAPGPARRSAHQRDGGRHQDGGGYQGDGPRGGGAPKARSERGGGGPPPGRRGGPGGYGQSRQRGQDSQQPDKPRPSASVNELVKRLATANEAIVGQVYPDLEKCQGDDKRKLADALKKAYQRLGRWDGQHTGKHSKKIDAIKKALGED